jgi:hypothetical protein
MICAKVLAVGPKRVSKCSCCTGFATYCIQKLAYVGKNDLEFDGKFNLPVETVVLMLVLGGLLPGQRREAKGVKAELYCEAQMDPNLTTINFFLM